MRAILAVLFMGLSATYLAAQNAEPEGAGTTADSPAVESSGNGDTSDESSSAEYAPLRIRIVDDPHEAERAKRREDDSDQRERDDLAAQKSMAESAEWTVFVSWWQLGLATAGTMLVFGSLYAAFCANKISRNTLNEVKETNRKQLRAYITVSAAKLVGTKNASPNFNIQILNSGQTPAQKIRWQAKIGVTEDECRELDGIDAKAQPIVGPGGKFTRTTAIMPWSWPKLVELLQDTRHDLYICGTIHYMDVFNQTHTTRYRMKFFVHERGIRDGDFMFCEDGNDAD